MTTRLFLRNIAASGVVAGTLPSGEKSAATADASFAWTTKTLDLAKGGNSNVTQAVSSVASVAQKREWLGIWLSSPLVAPQTIGAGSIVFSVAAFETNANSNFKINTLNAYIWRPSTGLKVGTIIDGPAGPTTAAVSEAGSGASYKVCYGSLTGSGVAALAGDVIVVELWSVKTQDSATSYGDQILYDGTTESTTDGASISGPSFQLASFVEFPETISFTLSIESGDGAASAAFAAAGVGTAIHSGAGSATILFSAMATARDYHDGVGSAAAVFAATAVGRSFARAVASAAFSVVGDGVSGTLPINYGAGAASFSFSAEAIGLAYLPHVFMGEEAAPSSWEGESSMSATWTKEAAGNAGF